MYESGLQKSLAKHIMPLTIVRAIGVTKVGVTLCGKLMVSPFFPRKKTISFGCYSLDVITRDGPLPLLLTSLVGAALNYFVSLAYVIFGK